MQGLDILLCRHSQLLVLRSLFHAETELTGREVERRTGLANRSVMLALEHLQACSAVHRREQTNAYLYTLNRQHYLVNKALIPAFEAEDLFWDDLRKTVRRLVIPRPLAAVATGALTRDELLPTGTIELTMIFASGRNRIKAYKAIDELIDGSWNRYAVNIEPVFLDINTIDEQEHEQLWKRVEREGILLFGTLP